MSIAPFAAQRVYKPRQLDDGRWCIAVGFEAVATETEGECIAYAIRNGMPLTEDDAQKNANNPSRARIIVNGR